MKNIIIYKNAIVLLTLFIVAFGVYAEETDRAVMKVVGDKQAFISQGISLPRELHFHDNEYEWMYISGVVKTESGRSQGLMYTMFQFPDQGDGRLYPTMLAVADIDNDKFYSARAWDPKATLSSVEDPIALVANSNSNFLWHPDNTLSMSSKLTTPDGDDLQLAIELEATRDILIHNESGYIDMADQVASGYFSYTNMLPTAGYLQYGETRERIVGGRIWLDRQWGDWSWDGMTWDWFSLRFDDGGSLMLFQFRNPETEAPIHGYWTYRDANDNTHYGQDFKVTAKRRVDQFPIDWDLSIPSLNAQFSVKPEFDRQIFSGRPLWEGLCDVRGEIKGKSANGHAFAEITMYDE